MKISLEANIDAQAGAPALDKLLTKITKMLEEGTGLKFDVKADGNTVRLAHKAKLLRKRAAIAVTAGAVDFQTVGKGKNVQEAFNDAVSEAQYENGHGGYSGTIAEKHSFVLIKPPAGVDPKKYAGWVQYAGEDMQSSEQVELKPGDTCPRCGKGKIEMQQETKQFSGKPYTSINPVCPACGASSFKLYNSSQGHGAEQKFFYSKSVAIPPQYRQQIMSDAKRIEDKWGPAGAVDIGGGKWLFFGSASS